MTASELPNATLEKLLGESAPNRAVKLDPSSFEVRSNGSTHLVQRELTLWCGNDQCDREMAFEPLDTSETYLRTDRMSENFLNYRCKHCENTSKTFALCLAHARGAWSAVKLGEFPPFGKPIPSVVNKLLQDDRVRLIKGLRSEELGFGVGAFSYYRQVVEAQWARLLDRIIQVATRTNAEPGLVEALRRAAKEQRFAESISIAKDAIPPVLLINGNNPISLLHTSLSEGLHSEDDAYCLDLATSIRELLYALGQRMAEALRNEEKLTDALDRLHQRKNQKPRIDAESPRPAPMDSGGGG